jgi:hypothetical protein
MMRRKQVTKSIVLFFQILFCSSRQISSTNLMRRVLCRAGFRSREAAMAAYAAGVTVAKDRLSSLREAVPTIKQNAGTNTTTTRDASYSIVQAKQAGTTAVGCPQEEIYKTYKNMQEVWRLANPRHHQYSIERGINSPVEPNCLVVPRPLQLHPAHQKFNTGGTKGVLENITTDEIVFKEIPEGWYQIQIFNGPDVQFRQIPGKT